MAQSNIPDMCGKRQAIDGLRAPVLGPFTAGRQRVFVELSHAKTRKPSLATQPPPPPPSPPDGAALRAASYSHPPRCSGLSVTSSALHKRLALTRFGKHLPSENRSHRKHVQHRKHWPGAKAANSIGQREPAVDSHTIRRGPRGCNR